MTDDRKGIWDDFDLLWWHMWLHHMVPPIDSGAHIAARLMWIGRNRPDAQAFLSGLIGPIPDTHRGHH